MQQLQKAFAAALRDPALQPPDGVAAPTGRGATKRFAVYRNNVMVGLISALEARFPATRRIVGEEFFKASARIFARAQPPRSPRMLTYGDEFPDFLATFQPAAGIAYLADVARLEAARTRAYHAADAQPLQALDFAGVAPDALAALRFELHPSLEIVASSFPVVTIWAINTGEVPFGPIDDWRGEDALVIRPAFEVEVRRLPAGAATFLKSLEAGATLSEAAETAQDSDAGFDLALNLAALVSGGLIVKALTNS